MWMRLLVIVNLLLIIGCTGLDTCYYLDHLLEDMFSVEDTPFDSDIPGNPGCVLLLIKEDPQGTAVYSVFGDACVTVPRGQGANSTALSVRNTRIAVLRKKDFENWSFIQSLNIETNEYLKTIEPGAFGTLSHLRNLSISNNYNLLIEPGIFEGLDNLYELRLVKNNLSSVKSIAVALSPTQLPQLYMLDLSDNPLNAIYSGDFEPMRGTLVKKLYFSYCNLLDIDPDALSPFRELVVLSLGRNYLNMSIISGLVESLNRTAPNLRTLNLDANLMHKKPYDVLQVIARTQISNLEIRENHFDPLVPGFFPKMPHIRSLDLSGIMATDMADNTINSTIMPKLKKLVLSKNRISGMSTGLMIPTLNFLDLSQNSGDSLSSLFKIGENQFLHMKALLVLNLSKNTLFHIKTLTFAGLNNLRVLLMKNCTIYKTDKFVFNETRSLQFLDLSYNSLSKTLTSYIFTGLNNLLGLNLDNCQITNLPDNVFSNLTSLTHLSLRGNSLVELSFKMFSPMPKLFKLDLSQNDILRWNRTLFHHNPDLRYLYLVSNQISELSFEMLRDFTGLDYLDLKDNPLECNCEMVLTTEDHLVTGNITMRDLHLGDTPNYCFSPRAWANVKIEDYIRAHMNGTLCQSETVVIVCIGIVGAMLFCMVVSVVLYYFRWHVRYWIFLTRQYFGHNHFPGRSKRESSGGYKYDAFVSYSNEDRSFVVRLTAMLEKQPPYLNLCVFERDFNIGDVISETVVSSVEASRRTILVLSDAYARSQWCLWEMYIAEHKKIFFKGNASDPDPLVIVKLGDIDDSLMTPTLRYLMKTRIYLEWSPDPRKQKIFWPKLRDALSCGKSKPEKCESRRSLREENCSPA